MKKVLACAVIALGLACLPSLAEEKKDNGSFSVIDTQDGYIKIKKEDFAKLLFIMQQYEKANAQYEILVEKLAKALESVKCL